MKSTLLSIFAIAALAGAQAASVEGNNTAVVIRRANTPSASGYQLICVPVRPFDITGGEGGTLLLKDILPPATYNGFTVQVNVTGDGGSTIYASDGANWKVSGGDTFGDDEVLSPGDVLWLHNQAQTATQVAALAATEGDDATVTLDPIVFCGEENPEAAQTQVTAPNGSLGAVGNESSTPQTLDKIFSGNYLKGAQISHIATLHDTDYTVYRYYGEGATGGWKKLDKTGVTRLTNGLADITLMPGEAVFYYANPATAN